MRKLRGGAAAKSIAARLVHPGHLMRAVKLQRGRKRTKRAFDDAQLALFARVLPTGFLHYGYFDDPARAPEHISLSEIHQAQRRYAELLLELAHDRTGPALDIGCGMGGLCAMLKDRGFTPVALTPDRNQAEYVRRTYPDVEVIESKFERMPDPDAHANRYATVFTSESLQYLKLDQALPLLRKILRPGGTWIACDFFRTGERATDGIDKAGHRWEEFRARVESDGWQLTFERDITQHVLPTLRYVDMWATQFGIPLLQFAQNKLRTKHPGLHYVLEDVLSMLDGVIEDNLQIIDPKRFAENKRYVMLALKRAG